MNLKKAIFIAILPLLCGCNLEFEADQELINKMWIETLKITNLPADTPMPEIALMNEDLYNKLVENNCASDDSHRKERCDELKTRVKKVLGKSYEETYKDYLESKDNKWSGPKDLARAFMSRNGVRVEIYVLKIFNYLWNLEEYESEKYGAGTRRFSYEEKNAFVYSAIAHEMLHIALYRQGTPAKNHHVPMKDLKLLENVVNVVSDHLKLPRDGMHAYQILRMLDARIFYELSR